MIDFKQNIIEQLANKYGVELIYTNEIEQGFCIEKSIYIGRFKDKELEILVFYHELAHTVLDAASCNQKWCNSKIKLELECWNIAFDLANNDGIFFSDDAVKYAYTCALTYANKSVHDSKSHLLREKIDVYKYSKHLGPFKKLWYCSECRLNTIHLFKPTSGKYRYASECLTCHHTNSHIN
jgi:hypothetical protein